MNSIFFLFFLNKTKQNAQKLHRKRHYNTLGRQDTQLTGKEPWLAFLISNPMSVPIFTMGNKDHFARTSFKRWRISLIIAATSQGGSKSEEIKDTTTSLSLKMLASKNSWAQKIGDKLLTLRELQHTKLKKLEPFYQNHLLVYQTCLTSRNHCCRIIRFTKSSIKSQKIWRIAGGLEAGAGTFCEGGATERASC